MVTFSIDYTMGANFPTLTVRCEQAWGHPVISSKSFKFRRTSWAQLSPISNRILPGDSSLELNPLYDYEYANVSAGSYGQCSFLEVPFINSSTASTGTTELTPVRDIPLSNYGYCTIKFYGVGLSRFSMLHCLKVPDDIVDSLPNFFRSDGDNFLILSKEYFFTFSSNILATIPTYKISSYFIPSTIPEWFDLITGKDEYHYTNRNVPNALNGVYSSFCLIGQQKYYGAFEGPICFPDTSVRRYALDMYLPIYTYIIPAIYDVTAWCKFSGLILIAGGYKRISAKMTWYFGDAMPDGNGSTIVVSGTTSVSELFYTLVPDAVPAPGSDYAHSTMDVSFSFTPPAGALYGILTINRERNVPVFLSWINVNGHQSYGTTTGIGSQPLSGPDGSWCPGIAYRI